MTRRFTACLLALLALGAPAAALAQPQPPITQADLRRHMEVLASDRFEGRKPGTPGEQLTTDYIVRELSARGVAPGAADGSWLQPVPLVERGASKHRLAVSRGGRRVALAEDQVVLTGREPTVSLQNAPIVFAGHGAVMPDRGIDQLAGADLNGAVALILYEGPQVEGFPSFTERLEMVRARGARAVIGIVNPEIPWEQVRQFAAGGSTQLDNPRFPDVFGAMSWEAAQALIRGAGMDLEQLLNDQPGSSFRSIPLPLRADLSVDTQVRRFTSNNVVGRIPGTRSGGESIVLLGHWDHLGRCGREGAVDRI